VNRGGGRLTISLKPVARLADNRIVIGCHPEMAWAKFAMSAAGGASGYFARTMLQPTPYAAAISKDELSAVGSM